MAQKKPIAKSTPKSFTLGEAAKKISKLESEFIKAAIHYDILVFAIVSNYPRKIAILTGNDLRKFELDLSQKVTVGELGLLYKDFPATAITVVKQGKKGKKSKPVGSMPEPYGLPTDSEKKITITLEGLRITEVELNRLIKALAKSGNLHYNVEVRNSTWLRLGDDKVKLTPTRFKILKCLWTNKNHLTTRRNILDIIENGNSVVGDSQVTNHVGDLITDFQKIGFEKNIIKKDIIETVNENKAKGREGGYIFHDNLVTLDF